MTYYYNGEVVDKSSTPAQLHMQPGAVLDAKRERLLKRPAPSAAVTPERKLPRVEISVPGALADPPGDEPPDDADPIEEIAEIEGLPFNISPFFPLPKETDQGLWDRAVELGSLSVHVWCAHPGMAPDAKRRLTAAEFRDAFGELPGVLKAWEAHQLEAWSPADARRLELLASLAAKRACVALSAAKMPAVSLLELPSEPWPCPTDPQPDDPPYLSHVPSDCCSRGRRAWVCACAPLPPRRCSSHSNRLAAVFSFNVSVSLLKGCLQKELSRGNDLFSLFRPSARLAKLVEFVSAVARRVIECGLWRVARWRWPRRRWTRPSCPPMRCCR